MIATERLLTEDRINEAIKIAEDNPYVVDYYPYAELTDEMLQKYFEAWDENNELDPTEWMTEYLYSDNWGYAADDHIRWYLSVKGFSEEEIDMLIEKHGIESYVGLDVDAEKFTDQDVLCRIHLFSNYDCMEEAYYASGEHEQGFRLTSSYLGDAVKTLCLSPMKLNAALESMGHGCEHTEALFDDSDAWVDYAGFTQELANNIGGGTLLCVLVKVPFRDLNEKELVLPKGSRVGFYGTFAGCGSLFAKQCHLKRSVTVQLREVPDQDFNPFWRLHADCTGGYSLIDCYGTYPTIFDPVQV